MGRRPEQIFIVAHDEPLCGVLLRDYDTTTYRGLKRAFEVTAEVRNTSRQAALPCIEVRTEDGLFLGHQVARDGRDAVFVHRNRTVGLALDWAALDGGELALGTRLHTGDGLQRDWNRNPVMLFDTVDAHGRPIAEPNAVSIGVGAAAVDGLVLYSATAVSGNVRHFDPYLYLPQ